MSNSGFECMVGAQEVDLDRCGGRWDSELDRDRQFDGDDPRKESAHALDPGHLATEAA